MTNTNILPSGSLLEEYLRVTNKEVLILILDEAGIQNEVIRAMILNPRC